MYKVSILSIAILLTGSVLNAQPGGPRLTVEERVKNVHVKVDSAFKPEAAKLVQVDSAFAVYYRAQDQLRAELMSTGERPDMQVMREKMQPLVEARDTKLKAALTAAQFETWKKEIEPTLMPRRGGGGGGPR